METDIVSAINKGFFQQVRYLVEFGSSVNRRDCNGRTPLASLALVDDEQWGVGLARLLLEHGARVSLRDQHGLNALHYACIYERKNLVEIFLSALDYDLNQGDKLGNTALHYAAASGNQEIVKLLVQTLLRYKLPLDRTNKRGMTPLMQAWKSGQIDCGRQLKLHSEHDETTRDVIFSRTAAEWEEEAIQNNELARKAASGSPTRDRYGRNYSRSVSASSNAASYRRTSSNCSSLSSSSAASHARHPSSLRPDTPFSTPRSTGSASGARLSRAASAPLLNKRQRIQHGSINDDSNKKIYVDDVIRRRDLCKKTIQNAVNNLRNKPEYVLQVSPADVFRDGSASRPLSNPAVEYLHDQDKACQNWRAEVLNMYDSFDFQFTDSFRKNAKQLSCDNLLRPSSPSASECYSEDVSSEFSTSLHPSKKFPRRTSTAKNITDKHAADKLRKASGSKTPQFRKVAQLTSATLKTFSAGIDSSSTESVNSVRPRSRKTSAITNEYIEEKTSHVGPIPVVKEPKAMGAIQE